MDLALAIEYLVPSAIYGGSTTDNSKENYDNLDWTDERKQPTWKALETAWIKYVEENPDWDKK